MSLTEENLLVVDDDDNFIAEAKRLFDGGFPPLAPSPSRFHPMARAICAWSSSGRRTRKSQPSSRCVRSVIKIRR